MPRGCRRGSPSGSAAAGTSAAAQLTAPPPSGARPDRNMLRAAAGDHRGDALVAGCRRYLPWSAPVSVEPIWPLPRRRRKRAALITAPVHVHALPRIVIRQQCVLLSADPGVERQAVMQ